MMLVYEGYDYSKNAIFYMREATWTISNAPRGTRNLTNTPINTKPPLHSSFLISMLLSLETWLFEFLIFLAERYDVWKPDKKKYSVSKFCPRSFRIFVRKVVSWVAFTMPLIITHIHDHCRYYELMNKIFQ